MASGKDILLGRIRSGEGLSFGQQLKLSLILSYPAILAQLSSVMMQYIDASMVGHLGPAAGASIGLVSTCLWLFGGFGMAVTSGFSVQVAHLVGANDFSGARSVLRQALVCVLGFSLFLAVTGMGISPFLPHWLGGGADITGDATSYFFIMTLFMPAMIMDFLSIGMCVLDVVFNYIFIYLLEMGVTGAALGSGLAEVVTGLAMFYFLTVRSPELNLRQEKGRGTISIAANSFAITAESFCYMPGYGIADASTTLVGQSIGAGRKPLAQRFAWITTFLAMGIMGLLAILMYLFAPQMMGLLTPDGAVIDLGARVLRIEAFAEVGYAASIVAYGACVGAGDTRIPSLMNFGSMWSPYLRPGGLLDLHGGGTELPRPHLPGPPVPGQMAVRENPLTYE